MIIIIMITGVGDGLCQNTSYNVPPDCIKVAYVNSNVKIVLHSGITAIYCNVVSKIPAEPCCSQTKFPLKSRTAPIGYQNYERLVDALLLLHGTHVPTLSVDMLLIVSVR